MILGVALPTVMFGGVGFLLISFIEDISGSTIPDQLRGMVALFWLFGVFLVTQRVASAKPRIDADQLMLTTVSARTAVGGLLIAEFLRILSYISFPVLVLSSLLAYAQTAPAFLITIPFAIMLFSATVATAGSAVGYGIALLIASSPFVAKHKTALSIPIGLLGVLGYLGFQYSEITGLDQSALAWFPAAWFADIAVVGGPIHGSLTRAAGVLLGSCVFVITVGRLAEIATTAYWFSDGPILTDSTPSERTTTGSDNHSEKRKSALANAVAPITVDFLPLPIQRVAQMVMLRTWRDPQRLMFIIMPVAIFIGPAISSVNGLDLFSVLPIASVVLIPWMAGAVFPLNPLGDEGSVLPVTLTAVTGTNYVRGLIAPSIILGLPAAVILTGITSLISPYPILTQFGLVVLAIYLTLVSAALGSGIGMLLPRYNAISIGQADEVIPPRITAVTLHGIAVCIPGCLLALLLATPELAQTMISILVGTLPGILLKLLATVGLEPLAGIATWFLTIGNSIQAIARPMFRLTTISVLGTSGIIVAIAAYRGATQRFNAFSPS
ncbi:hypothetical protein ACFFQF_17500 [Haladaptatus pallidirubidus]|uniref:hypothetical protein n=1 Tax=Haladaptatus pallidirubidus TaxID=1008152 RepID=UPI001D0FF51B|nr:hypothetical protein [Haladaptatus pallidirubidus]